MGNPRLLLRIPSEILDTCRTAAETDLKSLADWARDVLQAAATSGATGAERFFGDPEVQELATLAGERGVSLLEALRPGIHAALEHLRERSFSAVGAVEEGHLTRLVRARTQWTTIRAPAAVPTIDVPAAVAAAVQRQAGRRPEFGQPTPLPPFASKIPEAGPELVQEIESKELQLARARRVAVDFDWPEERLRQVLEEIEAEWASAA